MIKPSLFDQIGGDALRAVIEDFYDRIFQDIMIGFLFAGKDKQRLVDKEWEFAARLLGADVAYTGKPIRKAHASSPILGGHFERRLQLLKNVMADHAVPEPVQACLIKHTQSLRSLVTADQGSDCIHENNPGISDAT